MSAYNSAEEAVLEHDWDRAAELWYHIYLGEEHKSERAFVEASRALFESDDAEGACCLLRLGRKAFPQSPELLGLHGRVLEDSGFTRAAEKAFSAWAKVDADNPLAHLALGRVRLALGWEHAARLALQRSVELDGQNPATQIQFVRLYRATGELKLAYEHYLLGQQLGVRDPLFYLDGSLLVMELGMGEASPQVGLEWATRVTEQQPDNTCAQFLRGAHLQALGRRDEAIDAFRLTVETDPACVEALNRLARLYSEVGETERLVGLVTRALEFETDPVDRTRLLALVRPR